MPDPDLESGLLETAAAKLGVPASRLDAGPSVERARSVVTPLMAGGVVVAWHKRIRAGPEHRPAETVREMLERAESCTESAAAALSIDPTLHLAPVLGVGLDNLTIITGHVSGVPLGLPRLQKGHGVRSRLIQLRRTGRALGLIESATRMGSQPQLATADERMDAPLAALLQRTSVLPGRLDRNSLERRVHELSRRVEDAGYPAAMGHGDVSRTNVLVEAGDVGIIDAEWPVRLVGFDLATLAVRLELETAQVPLIGKRLVRELSRGYESVAPIGPGFHFEKTQRYLRLLATYQLRRKVTQRAAISYLTSAVPA